MRILISILAVFGFALPAVAYTEKQEGVLNNLANAMAFDSVCSTLQLNSEFARLASRFHDVDLEDPATDSEVQKRVAKALKEREGETEDVLCRAGLHLFGPEGERVPNLLQEAQAAAEQVPPSQEPAPPEEPAPSSKIVAQGAATPDAGSSDFSRVITVLQDMGYRAATDNSSTPPAIESKFSGIDSRVQVLNCDEGTTNNCGMLRFHAGFDLTDGLDMKSINAWNLDKYFGRAYLDAENDPHVDVVVSMVGVNDDTLKDLIEWWEIVIGDFKEHINW